MSCQAIKNKEVDKKGEVTIEYYEKGKPVYYCYGWNDDTTKDLIETCSKCKKNVIYAQIDLEEKIRIDE